MNTVHLRFGDTSIDLQVRALDGEERVGEGVRFEISAISAEPIEPAKVLGKLAVLEVVTGRDARMLFAVVTRFTTVATAQERSGRKYRVSLRSGLALMELHKRPRIFQHLTVPKIIEKVLVESGWPAANIEVAVQEDHAERPYVVQYAETDAAFLRRMCEEDGLYFRFEPGDAGEKLILQDSSAQAPERLPAALALVADSGMSAARLVAYPMRVSLARRVGKVTLRDYDYEHAAVKLEAVLADGTPVEKDVEVYEAPGRFKDGGQGKRRAKLRLEQLRADGTRFFFRTNAVSILPGTAVTIESTGETTLPTPTSDKQFVVGLKHAWRIEQIDHEYLVEVESVPLDVPYRLPRVTPRPRLDGLHTATVTGPAGEEIHTDAQGRVNVKFPWDREGPTDDKSSLPIRVMQPNTPGSMLIPRINWEVLVAFEDGDPDRPVVVGRTYNAKQPPPQSLPANKTLTSLGTWSSPGGGKMNAIHFDDAAGRQNIAVVAAFGKSTAVANNLMSQTAAVEKIVIKGSQGSTVGANDDVSIKQAYIVMVGSQSASVGAVQKIFVKGNMAIGVGSERVLIGAALIEKVGNPVTGALNLGSAAALSGLGGLGRAGAIASTALSLGRGGVEGFMRGGWRGAANAVAGGAIGQVAGMVPGGDAVLGALGGGGALAPWAPTPPAGGAAAAGGGAGGAEGDGAGAAGPGPGHRTTKVKGTYTELIGALHAIVSPGSVSWQTVGASTFLVGGSHNTTTKSAAAKTLGASTELLGSLKIKAATDIIRDVKGAITTKIAGTLKSTAGGKHEIKAGGPLSIKVGGSFTLNGAHVSFVVGGAKLSSSPSGVLIEAGDIEINGKTTQSGVTGHS